MLINGLQKLTLLDFPGHVACTVFTGGCNLRCPFCHNALLVTETEDLESYPEEDILAFLEKRRGVLDGIALTGGEPLIQKGVREFIEKVRALGYLVKLDTNGTRPEVLRELLTAGLLDYVAVDIKNSPEKYGETVGVPDFDITPVRETVDMLIKGSVPYEFRTTVVREYHSEESIGKIGQWIAGAERYFLQNFEDSGQLIGENLHAHDKNTLRLMKETAEKYVKSVAIRGID